MASLRPIDSPILPRGGGLRRSNLWIIAAVSFLSLPLMAQAGDFRLLVDGREVPVEYFTEIQEGTSVAPKPVDAPTAPSSGRIKGSCAFPFYW